MPVVIYRSKDKSGATDALLEELVQIDENLVRKNLTGAAADKVLVRRKKIYETLYPETKRGTAGAAASNRKRTNKSASDKSSVATDSFVKDTAKKTGKSERSIERAVRRAEKASPRVQAAREHMELGTSQTDELIKLSPDEQDRLLPTTIGKSVGEVKKLVVTAKENGSGMAIEEVSASVNEDQLYSDLQSRCRRLTTTLDQILLENTLFTGSRDQVVPTLLQNIKRKIEQVIAFQAGEDESPHTKSRVVEENSAPVN